MTKEFILKESPNSICVIRLSAIGDVCHMVSVVQAIQRRHPNAKITWIIGKLEVQLIQDLPGVEFVIFDKKQGIRAYWQLRRTLKDRVFDVLLHAQVALRASMVSCCVRARIRIGFDNARAKDGQWIFTNQKIRQVAKQHVLEGLHEFARCLDAVEEKPTWQVPIPESCLLYAKEQLPKNQRILIINPAASNAERNWTIEGYAKIATIASAEFGMAVVLTGSPAPTEVALAKQIVAACATPIINLVGQTSLKQCLALQQNADVVIGPDTGPLHMATMLNKPVIGLYAASNPKRTGPYLSLATTVDGYPEALMQFQQKAVEEVPFGRRVHAKSVMELITVQQVRSKLQLIANNWL